MAGKILGRLMKSYTTVKPLASFHSLIPPITTTLLSQTQISPTMFPKISPTMSPKISPIRPFSARIPYPEFGIDYKHWFIQVKDPEPHMTRDQIIEMYVKILASVVGCEQEARMKIYSVSTKCYFAFGALISEELSSKLKDIPNVVLVSPDSYVKCKDKDYGGEPFIDGKAVPYDPKYHASYWRFQNAMRETLDDLTEISDSDSDTDYVTEISDFDEH